MKPRIKGKYRGKYNDLMWQHEIGGFWYYDIRNAIKEAYL